jgi:hypothetical protein
VLEHTTDDTLIWHLPYPSLEIINMMMKQEARTVTRKQWQSRYHVEFIGLCDGGKKGCWSVHNKHKNHQYHNHLRPGIVVFGRFQATTVLLISRGNFLQGLWTRPALVHMSADLDLFRWSASCSETSRMKICLLESQYGFCQGGTDGNRVSVFSVLWWMHGFRTGTETCLMAKEQG